MVHVLGGLGFGGTERLCLSIVRQGAPSARSVVVCLDPNRSGMEPLFQAVPGVTLLKGPGKRHADVVRWMTRFLEREQPDGVIVYAFGVAHLAVALAAHRAGIRRVLVSAGNPPPVNHHRWKWRAIVLASRVLRVPIQACSRAVYDQLVLLGVGLPARSGVIHNGCNVSAIAREVDTARAARQDHSKFVIGMVARLDAIKDHDTLVRAVASLKDHGSLPPLELWLIGDGKRRQELERLVTALQAEQVVKFLGTRDDIPCLLGQLDLFAFSTTRDEGFGIALIEAMAAGLPIVASRVAACTEVVGADDVGVLVEPGSPEAWANALIELITSATRRVALGRRAREVATARFSAEVCRERWLEKLGVKFAPAGKH